MRTRPASDRATERSAEPVRELAGREAMILRPRVSDLDRPEQRGDATRGFPVVAFHQPVHETRAVGVPAAGRIEHGVGPRGGNRDLATARHYHAALRAARDDQGFDSPGYRGHILSGPVAQQLRLVVIDSDPSRTFDEAPELFA